MLRNVSAALLAALLVAACAAGPAPTAPSAPGSSQSTAAISDEDLLRSLLPDRTSADCVGRLEFVGERRVEGRSDCSGAFSGTTDTSVSAGTLCVYSYTVLARTATEASAGGNFVCSDGNHGTVVFKEKRGVAVGIATITAADGRVVTLTYQ
ncbi:hypothetical protein [Dongia rigui]|uniref:Lipoprotein n=1 Tax=Dongia rigui TaxID=940149 RepID=A0ABU5DVP8_9PROT|nr:hypothetical protein [Dongia rigui]MDY0870783.1 hypothetical protein [Dongia rigui]